MDFCKICMNLLEISNNKYKCNSCNNTTENISQNTILFHEDLKKNIVNESINNLKKNDIYRRKKEKICKNCNNNEFILYSNNYFHSEYICTKCNSHF